MAAVSLFWDTNMVAVMSSEIFFYKGLKTYTVVAVSSLFSNPVYICFNRKNTRFYHLKQHLDESIFLFFSVCLEILYRLDNRANLLAFLANELSKSISLHSYSIIYSS